MSDPGNDRRATRTVAAVTARRAARPGLLWGLVFGGTIAATMTAYSSTFPSAAERANIARTIEGNAAFEAIFGVTRRLDTVAGYTTYKTMFTLVLLGAIWGLFIATKVLRGEEDAGRWELLLSGQTTRRGATISAGAGLAAGLAALWLPTALIAVVAGSGSKVGIGAGACLFFATSAVAAAAMFMAVGMLVSQLAPSRHGANVMGAGILAASYLVRMAADSDHRIGGLRWVSPLGWVEELRPLTGSRPLAFVPIVLLTAACAAVAVSLAGSRDVGAGVLAGDDRPPPRTWLLGGQAGLTVRLSRPTIAAWLAGLALTGFVFGLVTQAAGASLRGSPTLQRVIARLGATGSGAAVYLGYVFVIAAGLVAIAVAGQISAIRNEEAEGHLDVLLVAPVARWRWLAVRLGVGVVLVLSAGAVTGLAAWIGASSQHADLGLGDLLRAGLNVTPPALFVLGVGALVYGLRPRAAIGLTYGLVAWSFLAETIASVTGGSRWLRDSSPVLHITPAPAASPDWTAAVWLVGLGLLFAAVGVVAFARRDLVGA